MIVFSISWLFFKGVFLHLVGRAHKVEEDVGGRADGRGLTMRKRASLFLSAFLRLSRACLGRMINVTIKWHVFSYLPFTSCWIARKPVTHVAVDMLVPPGPGPLKFRVWRRRG
jgi:hypothetical protein